MLSSQSASTVLQSHGGPHESNGPFRGNTNKDSINNSILRFPRNPSFNAMDSHHHRRLPSLQTILSPQLDMPVNHYQPIHRPHPADSDFAARYHSGPHGGPDYSARSNKLVPFASSASAHSSSSPPGPRPPPTSQPLPSLNAQPQPSSPPSYSYTYTGPSPPHHSQPPPPPPPPPSHVSPSQVKPNGLMGRLPPPNDTRGSGESSTQPKVTQIKHVEGLGECYFYDNGTYLQCSIAGEPVNPNWGVTKAGKPRKRLAQACMACREKKVRCPLKPGQSKCDHCAKAGRICEKPSTHRASPEAESSDTAITDQSRAMPRSSPFARPDSTSVLSRKRSVEYLSVPEQNAPTPLPRGVSPGWNETSVPNGGLKRQKSEGSTLNPPWNNAEASSSSSNNNNNNNNNNNGSSSRPVQPEISYPQSNVPEVSAFSWDADPFEGEAATMERIIRLYYAHRGRNPYTMFLEEPFINWAIHCKDKTRDDRMVLYGVLALGARFSPDYHEASWLGQQLAMVAQHATSQRNGKPSLQLAQARIYLCLYFFAKGDNELGWEYLTASYSTIGALNLNTEEGAKDVHPEDDGLYGLNKVQLIECRRRTFWLGYMIDRVFYLQDQQKLTLEQQRYIGFAGGHIATFHDADILIRLPQTNSDYLHGGKSDSPYYTDIYTTTKDLDLSEMALLVLIVSLWGEVTAQMYRTKHRPSREGYLEQYEGFYRSYQSKMQRWKSLLPPMLQYSQENTRRALSQERLSIYFVIQSVALVTSIKMHRFGRYSMMPVATVKYNIRQAYSEARNLLSIASQLARVVESSDAYNDDVEYCLAQPFPGYALLAACDIVSIGGASTEVMQHTTTDLSQAKMVLAELARYWFTAGKQEKKVNQRLVQFSAIGLKESDGRWRLDVPIDASFLGLEHDLIYGVPPHILQEALGNM